MTSAKPLRNESGVALVIVLLVVALLTISTLEFATATNIYAHMTRNSINGVQATLMARSGINIGEAILMHDEDPTTDGFAEEWCPEPLEQSCRVDETLFELPPNVRLRIEIFDESGKINLNLTRPRLQEVENYDPANPSIAYAWQSALQRLFETRGVDPIAIERLEEYWVQRLEENQEEIGASENTENQQNQQNQDDQDGGDQQDLTPSQVEALLDFPSIDDANVVLGLNPADLERLRDFVTALPKRHYPWINANTAPREVLDAVTGDGSISESIITQRLEAPLQLADWTQLVSGLDTQDPEFARVRQMARVTSRIFRVTASALVNPDPTTGLGGIGRTASMVVRRVPSPTRRSDESGGRWTLTRLDWQKEGGAKLFFENRDLAPEAGEDELGFF